MPQKLKATLPILAVAAAALLVLDVGLLSVGKREARTEDPAIRSAVEATLAGLGDLHPESPQDPAFLRAAQALLDTPHIATVWVFTPAGRLILAEGATAASTPVSSTAEDLATVEATELISVLPPSVATPETMTWLLAASAIRREGSHNDVYRHLLRAVTRDDGSAAALVGVNYEAAEWDAGIAWNLAVLFAPLSLALYWMSLPLWVFLDGRERGARAVPWATFVLVGNLVALMAYLLTRPPEARNAGDQS